MGRVAAFIQDDEDLKATPRMRGSGSTVSAIKITGRDRSEKEDRVVTNIIVDEGGVRRIGDEI